MSAAGHINARVLQRGPRPVVEVALEDEIFHVTLYNEWNSLPDEDLESRAIVVLIEERDRHPSKSLHDLDHQVAEPFIADMRPESPEAAAPGYRWSYQVPGELKHRHYLRLTVEAAAGLPFEAFPQISHMEAKQLLIGWMKRSRIKGTTQVPETITITSADVDTLRPFLNG